MGNRAVVMDDPGIDLSLLVKAIEKSKLSTDELQQMLEVHGIEFGVTADGFVAVRATANTNTLTQKEISFSPEPWGYEFAITTIASFLRLLITFVYQRRRLRMLELPKVVPEPKKLRAKKAATTLLEPKTLGAKKAATTLRQPKKLGAKKAVTPKKRSTVKKATEAASTSKKRALAKRSRKSR